MGGVSGGDRYALFQVAYTLLGVTVLLPCVLIARLFGGRPRAWLTAALLACNPLFVQNATYSWPRLLCAFYVIFGIWLYVRGWRRRDGGARMTAAVGSLAADCRASARVAQLPVGAGSLRHAFRWIDVGYRDERPANQVVSLAG